MLFACFIIIYQQIEGESVFNKYSCIAWPGMYSIGHWRKMKESIVTWRCCSRSVRPSRAQRRASRSSLPSSAASLTGKMPITVLWGYISLCYFTGCQLVVTTRWASWFSCSTQIYFCRRSVLQNSIVLFNLRCCDFVLISYKNFIFRLD